MEGYLTVYFSSTEKWKKWLTFPASLANIIFWSSAVPSFSRSNYKKNESLKEVKN